MLIAVALAGALVGAGLGLQLRRLRKRR